MNRSRLRNHLKISERLNPKSALLVALTAIFLTGCSTVPKALEGDYTGVSITQAREKSENTQVRWGGVIAKVENKKEQSVIEVVAKPLASSTRPRDNDESSGRFLAVIPDFVDPLVYKPGREVTVVGQVSEVVEGQIGEMDYVFPVVNVSGYHLWKKRRPTRNVNTFAPGFWPGWGPGFGPFLWGRPFWFPPRVIRAPAHTNG